MATIWNRAIDPSNSILNEKLHLAWWTVLINENCMTFEICSVPLSFICVSSYSHQYYRGTGSSFWYCTSFGFKICPKLFSRV
jgi:hypothetical protein